MSRYHYASRTADALDLAAVRSFLEQKWAERGRPDPDQSCVATASFLSKLIPGAEIRGGQPEGHRDLVQHGMATEEEARSGGGYRDDDGYLMPHIWVETGGSIYDLTADQFGGDPVTVTGTGDDRYVPSELSEKNTRALRAVDAETDEWMEEWESGRTASSDWDSRYPVAGDSVDGRTVLADVPNTPSISASFDDWEELPGIREVPMSDFGGPRSVFYAADDFRRSRELASRIRESGEISPLIIAIDDEEPYILEGAHRFVALHELGAVSFPALVVIDMDDPDPTVAASRYHEASRTAGLGTHSVTSASSSRNP